jgi:L-ribulose-5-phosphate 3-epimerase
MNWTRAACTLCFRPYSLEEALRGIRAAGFEAVEISAYKGFVEHLDPDDLGDAVVRRTRGMLDGLGLSAVSIAGHTFIRAAEGAHTTVGKERLRRLLHAGAALGAKVLITDTVPLGVDERADLVRNLRDLGDEALEAGLRICIETDWNLTPNGAAAAAFTAEVGHAAVGVNYDTGNVAYLGLDPQADVADALPAVGHVHLKDQRGGPESFDFPALGQGGVDLGGFLRVLDAAAFRGPISLQIEFDGTWPSWGDCLAAAQSSRSVWDRLDAGLGAGAGS